MSRSGDGHAVSALPPESGHLQCKRLCPLWANSGHLYWGRKLTVYGNWLWLSPFRTRNTRAKWYRDCWGSGCRRVRAMTTEVSVDNSKIEAICRECGNTLPAPELAEFFNEEQLILNFWSCSNCGFQFETEEKICSEATSQIDESNDKASLFPETFFPSPRF